MLQKRGLGIILDIQPDKKKKTVRALKRGSERPRTFNKTTRKHQLYENEPEPVYRCKPAAANPNVGRILLQTGYFPRVSRFQ